MCRGTGAVGMVLVVLFGIVLQCGALLYTEATFNNSTDASLSIGECTRLGACDSGAGQRY